MGLTDARRQVAAEQFGEGFGAVLKDFDRLHGQHNHSYCPRLLQS